MKSKISAALTTYNEETNIIDCIKSLQQFASEIVVVDSNSSDRTASLAKGMGTKVVETTNKPMFHINKNLAIKNCKNPWIFLIDADERVSPQLAEEIKKVTGNNPKENGFWINRRNWFLGGYLKKGGAYPDSVIRLFKRGKGRLPEISVHEQVKIEGETGHLESDILHFADPDFSRYLMRANRYTELTAQMLKEQKPGLNPITIFRFVFVRPISTFISIFFLHKGYADSFRGFIWALFSSAHHFYAFVKYSQLQKGKS